MNTPFFITGTVRSRTGWLAAYLTTHVSVCEHELMARLGTLSKWQEWLNQPGPLRGESSSALMGEFKTITSLYPEAKWVLVRRDPEEAWESLCKFVVGGPWGKSVALSSKLKETLRRIYNNVVPWMIADPRVLVVPFEHLSDLDVLRCIWQHCLGAAAVDIVPWSRERAELFTRLRVNLVQELCPLQTSPEMLERFSKWLL